MTEAEKISAYTDRLLARARQLDDETQHLREKKLRDERLLSEEMRIERRHVKVIYQDKIDELRSELCTYERLLTVKIGNRKVVTEGLFAKALAAHKRALLNKIKQGEKK